MANGIPNSGHQRSRSFQQVADAFLAGPGLPFADVLSAERIERIFAKHGCLFGRHGVYTVAITVWAFLSQVLRDGKEAACQAAVANVVSYCTLTDCAAPSDDTGEYCRARAKLSEEALHELASEIAAEMEQSADEAWLWKGRHAKLVDGFTATMPDTPDNQAEYPQQKTQTPGVGLPIFRAVAILSLATGCIADLALGPYEGKETGETALLRSMLASFSAGDVAVMDRFYCSFMMIAALFLQGTDVCTRKHQRRHSDFRRGQRLGKYDHLITWTRPARPEWMDEATYEQIPKTLELREIRYNIVRPGCRTRTIDIITTLTDAEEYTKEDIAQLYGFRWHSELDIRCIKSSLNMDHLRCKSPEMVRREVWTIILGYNLIRTTAAAAALLHGKQPRQISFTSTCQYVLTSWMMLSLGQIDSARLEAYLHQILRQIAACEVGNRPGRLEPRVLKRRRHRYKLMRQPRSEMQRELRKQCT